MAKLLVLTDPETAIGFRLAGLDPIEASSEEEAAGRLLAFLASGEPAVLVYNEEYRLALPEQSQAALDTSLAPIFFAIPSRRAGRPGQPPETYVARLLRRTIGYQVKLKR